MTSRRGIAACIVIGQATWGKGKKEHPADFSAGCTQTPAMTYSRPRRTTIGPGCLTAVFGMGTGGTIRGCSPRKLTPIQPLLIHRFALAGSLRARNDESRSDQPVLYQDGSG